jgi:hypothetical protein
VPLLINMDRLMYLREDSAISACTDIWEKLCAEYRTNLINENHKYLKGLCRIRASRRDSNTGSRDDAGDLRIDSWKSRLDK